MEVPEEKTFVVFDLDDTLTPSKTPADAETLALLCSLLKKRRVAVISGASFAQLKKQFAQKLSKTCSYLENLYLLPTCGAVFYRYKNGWRKIYGNSFNAAEKKRIREAFRRSLGEVGFGRPRRVYGDILEDREHQITFSAFGQKAPLRVKEGWDPRGAKRREIIRALKKYIPEFQIRAGGSTSIDVTNRGIDKAYGINQLITRLGVGADEIVFVGDAFYRGGNDHPVIKTGVSYIKTSGPEETKAIVRSFIHKKKTD